MFDKLLTITQKWYDIVSLKVD